MTAAIREEAPAKVNLVLEVGTRRPGGLHELCSLFASLDLHDVVTVEARGHADEVICPGVEGPNLAAAAIEAVRASGAADLPPLRVTIEKRIPVAAGLGGGSADAAAVLRAARELAAGTLGDDMLHSIAASLGSDVPSQVRPAHALVTGTGDVVEPVALPRMWLVLVPSTPGLATSEVYAEAERLGATGQELDPDALRRLAGEPLEVLARALHSDLEPAALHLRPNLRDTIAALEDQGALGALVSGSGPTVFGAFAGRDAAERAAAGIDGSIVTGLRERL